MVDHERGRVFRVTASTIKGKHRLGAYAELVFATALAPETSWESILIGKRDKEAKVKGTVVVKTGPLLRDASAGDRHARALDLLGALVELYVEGHRHPLPLPCETGYTWLRQTFGDEYKAEGMARKAFEGPYGDADAFHRLAAPDLVTFDALRAAGFEDYCRRLWMPVLTLSGEANR